MSAFNLFVSIFTVLALVSIIHFINKQALMMNKEGEAKDFKQMGIDDKDLVMFTITDLKLEKNKEQVHMVISLKRKIQTEMLTTYLPTLLLLITTYATTFFKQIYFEASLTVNLTIMLVMTTIFTSKIEELPPTSDMKMIDVWLIFCLVVPFLEVILRTAIECISCNCKICEQKKTHIAQDAKDEKEDDKKGGDTVQGASSSKVTRVRIGTGAKVAPSEKVAH